jgi:DNA-directed RNA polymerase subunit H
MKKGKVTIREHVLVPRHEGIDKEEVKELLEKYKIKKEQLPKIKSSDPVCKEIEAVAGDVVKITRRSRTAGKFISYRLVIE